MPITPLMQLTIPSVGVTPGPQWAQILNDAFYRIDSHTHSPGEGAQINQSSFSPTGDLNMNGFNIINARSYRAASQVAPLVLPTDVNQTYSVLGDLYFNNGAGVPIKITSGTGFNALLFKGFTGDYGASPAEAFYDNAITRYGFYSAAPAPGTFADVEARNFLATNSITAANDITAADTVQGLFLFSTGNIQANGNITANTNMFTTNLTATADVSAIGLTSTDPEILLRKDLLPSGGAILGANIQPFTDVITNRVRSGVASDLTIEGGLGQRVIINDNTRPGADAIFEFGTPALRWDQVCAERVLANDLSLGLQSPATSDQLSTRHGWNNILAWGRVNGAGTPSAGYLNISFVNRISAGRYQVNFSANINADSAVTVTIDDTAGAPLIAKVDRAAGLITVVLVTTANVETDRGFYFMVVGAPA